MSARQHTGAAATNTNPIFVTIKEYCELLPSGLNTGKMLAEQVDGNPNSRSYGQQRTIVVSLKSQFCPISAEPLWMPTGLFRCKKDENDNNNAFRENEQRDVNPNSPSAGKTRFVNGGKDFNACPLPQWPFVRILADFQTADSPDSYRIAARIKDKNGNIFTVEANDLESKNNYADINLPFGDYLLTKVEAAFAAKFASKYYLKQIYAVKLMEENFTQKSPENKIAGGKKCLCEKELNIPFTLTNGNRSIHFVFDMRAADAKAISYKATRTASFTRNNCPPDSQGTTVSFTKEYFSLISQDEAENIARNDKTFGQAGQFYANDGAASGSACVLKPKTAIIALQIIEPPQQFPQLSRRYGYKISSTALLTEQVVAQVRLHYQNTDDPIGPDGPIRRENPDPVGPDDPLRPNGPLRPDGPTRRENPDPEDTDPLPFVEITLPANAFEWKTPDYPIKTEPGTALKRLEIVSSKPAQGDKLDGYIIYFEVKNL